LNLGDPLYTSAFDNCMWAYTKFLTLNYNLIALENWPTKITYDHPTNKWVVTYKWNRATTLVKLFKVLELYKFFIAIVIQKILYIIENNL